MDNHITGSELCTDMLRRGFRFQINGEELRCRGTREQLSPELLQQLKHRKPEILSYFNSVQPSIRSIQLEEASQLYRERGWVKIWSCFLNQAIYLVKNDAVKTPKSEIPRYTESEILALNGLNLEELKTLHYAKELFGGSIGTKNEQFAIIRQKY